MITVPDEVVAWYCESTGRKDQPNTVEWECTREELARLVQRMANSTHTMPMWGHEISARVAHKRIISRRRAEEIHQMICAEALADDSGAEWGPDYRAGLQRAANIVRDVIRRNESEMEAVHDFEEV